MISMTDIVSRLAFVDAALDDAAANWRIECLALVTEIGEFVNELPWRPWRKADQRDISATDLALAENELGDIFGTAIRIAMHVGYTGEDIERVITEHVETKERRVKTGIDGRA